MKHINMNPELVVLLDLAFMRGTSIEHAAKIKELINKSLDNAYTLGQIEQAESMLVEMKENIERNLALPTN